MKNHKIYSMYDTLMELKDKEMPVKVSFPIARNLTILKPIATDIYQQRMGIIAKYRDPNDATLIKTEYIDICNQELEELAEIDTEVTLVKIKLSDLPDDFNVTPQQLVMIQDILEED